VYEWNVLRETDGERFVVPEKGCCFSGEFADPKKQMQAEKICSAIKNILYVISYPLATELFAF